MNQEEMKDRTKQFSLRVIRLVNALPKTVEGKAISGQLIRSGMSVGANYRAACRSRSTMEFLSKLGTVEEEADESAYWMELVIESCMLSKDKVEALLREANEITAIIAASRKTVKSSVNRKSKI